MISDRVARYGGHDLHAKIGRHGPRLYSFDEITDRLRVLVILVAGRAGEQMPSHDPAASWVELAFHVGCDQAARETATHDSLRLQGAGFRDGVPYLTPQSLL